MTETFTPPHAPDKGATKKSATKSLEADFGDGYTQRAPDGLNTVRRSLNLTWSLLTPDQADDIEEFFEARKGSESFFWTAPREASPRKWRAKAWDRPYAEGTHDSITVTFDQVFDL